MAQPLGDAVGNALDIREAIEVLKGEHRGRLRELAVAFAAQAASVTLLRGIDAAASDAQRALDDGSALERFHAMIVAQGGDPAVIDDPIGVLPAAPVVVPILAGRSGTVASVATEEIGLASGALGAGRAHKGDRIDPAVGIVVRCKIGDSLEVGERIGEVHARDEDSAGEGVRRVLDAIVMSEGPVTVPPLVHTWLE